MSDGKLLTRGASSCSAVRASAAENIRAVAQEL